jgi:hypothetical protein
VAQTAPGVFTVDGVHAWALNQDGSINTATNRAPAGSIVSVFATGLGPIDPFQEDGALVGSPLPSNVVQTGVEAQSLVPSPPFGLSLTSMPVSITYAGPAPYNVAGASQINFLIPSPNYDIDFYLALPGPNLTNMTSQFFEIWVVGQERSLPGRYSAPNPSVTAKWRSRSCLAPADSPLCDFPFFWAELDSTGFHVVELLKFAA